MAQIFVNRILNLKRIKAIGFDMDHTIVRYHYRRFEELAYNEIRKKLIALKGYPKALDKLKFDPERAIRGLVVDKKKGNLIKLSFYGRIKSACHGFHELNYEQLKVAYHGQFVDLSDPNYYTVDTTFSVSYSCLYAQLVELKDQDKLQSDKGVGPLSYVQIAEDLEELLDLSHRDGTLKGKVRENIEKFIVQDPEIVTVLERFKKYDKKLLVITNSDFAYTKLLLDYAINPFLKEHKDWTELFDFTITLSAKPQFFTERFRFLKIDEKTGMMENVNGALHPGIYQGGNAKGLQKELGLDGDDILYIGDHIYGDILLLKKACDWRTALVIEELEDEITSLKKAQPLQQKIDALMEKKEKLELEINEIYVKDLKKGDKNKKITEALFKKIDALDSELSQHIPEYQKFFNPYWGEIMRAGQEQSRLAGQIEKYACIYMSKISDFYAYSPRTYFRPRKRYLPHELITLWPD